MEDEDLLQLAIRACERLQSVAGALCVDMSCVQFCVTLKELLTDISQWLENLPADAQDALEDVAALLEQLESICPPVAQCAWTEQDGMGARFASFSQLLANVNTVTGAVRSLASGKNKARQRRTLLGWLGSFLPQVPGPKEKVDTSPSDSDLQALSAEPPDCGKEITSLHKTLYTYCSCTESDGVVARVRLRNEMQENGAGVTFGVLFMAHPHQDATDPASQPLWQDTHICVLRTVKFGTNESGEREEIHLDSDASFCSYISEHDDYGSMLLKFSVTGQRFYFEDRVEPKRQWIFDKPSIPLGRILEDLSASTSEATEKRKEVLSWLLAKAVWQYYNSPWMQIPWNKNTVHFLFERQQSSKGSRVAEIFVNEPFLSCSICPEPNVKKAGDATSAPKPGRVRKPLHPIPKILALGVMLVEVQLGHGIEKLYGDEEWEQYCPKGVPNANTNYRICKELISRDKFFTKDDSEVSVPLEMLITNCIQPKERFLPPVVRDEQGIRDALYTLVNRLELYLSERKPHTVRPLTLAANTSSKHQYKTPPKSPKSPKSPPSIPLERTRTHTHRKPRSKLGRTMTSWTSTSTNSWLDRMRSVNDILRAQDDDGTFAKVKIAVVDTGVDANDAAAEYITGYRDFVDEDDGVKRDNTGHGTTSVNLVIDMCETAEVYALRVFEADEANERTLGLAIKAIKWCIAEEMDIVCMACGFGEDNDDLFNVIHEASRKMLIFAAPTNESNAAEIAFPAGYDAEVFCIFSTNGGVTNSRHLNPTKGLGKYNFAILGEDIMTYTGKQASGTSLATAIAAGFAGQLLEFSRHGECRDRIQDAKKMSLKRNMTKVFQGIAVRDADFWCLKPWRLLPESLRNQIPFTNYWPSEKEIQEARVYTCSLITHKLAGN